MTFSSNRDCAQRMIPNDSGCPLTSPLAPSRGWHLWFLSETSQNVYWLIAIKSVHQICTNISAELYMPHSFCLWTNSIKLITSLHLYFLCSNPRFWVHFFYLARDYLCHFRCPNKVVENQVNRLACLHPDWSPDTCVSCCAGHDAMFPGLS